MTPPERNAAIRSFVILFGTCFGLLGRLVVNDRFVGRVLLVPRIGLAMRGIDADADQFFSRDVDTQKRPEQLSLGARHEANRTRRRDDIGPERESQHRTQAQAWKQDATFGRDGQSVDGRPVNQREEHERVVGPMLPLEMLDQPWRRRPEPADPVHFFGAGARRRKNAIGELPERRRRRAAG